MSLTIFSACSFEDLEWYHQHTGMFEVASDFRIIDLCGNVRCARMHVHLLGVPVWFRPTNSGLFFPSRSCEHLCEANGTVHWLPQDTHQLLGFGRYLVCASEMEFCDRIPVLRLYCLQTMDQLQQWCSSTCCAAAFGRRGHLPRKQVGFVPQQGQCLYPSGQRPWGMPLCGRLRRSSD